VHYISTNGIFPEGKHDVYMEDCDIGPFADRLTIGYDQAKWVAEKLVWEAASRNMPVCVYRPGNIGHHSHTGAANPNDFQTMLINACRKVGWAPDNHTWAFEITPVDFLVKAIVAFSKVPAQFGRVFNVVQPCPTSARAVFDLLLELGGVLGYVPVDEWKSRLMAKGQEKKDHILSVLTQSLDDVERYLKDRNRYDCSSFKQALAAHGLEWPMTDAQYFMKIVTTTSRQRPSGPGR
jgi:thioester reductase-like protein